MTEFSDTLNFMIDTARGVTRADLAPLLHPDLEVRRRHVQLRADDDPEYLNRVAAAKALIAIGLNPLTIESDDG